MQPKDIGSSHSASWLQTTAQRLYPSIVRVIITISMCLKALCKLRTNVWMLIFLSISSWFFFYSCKIFYKQIIFFPFYIGFMTWVVLFYFYSVDNFIVCDIYVRHKFFSQNDFSVAEWSFFFLYFHSVVLTSFFYSFNEPTLNTSDLFYGWKCWEGSCCLKWVFSALMHDAIVRAF